MTGRKPGLDGFSLVEVVLALGVASFALLTLLALVPVGTKNNKISTDETRGMGILTALAADLKGSHPLANGGVSILFHLPLPYSYTAASGLAFNTALQANVLYTTGLSASELPVPPSSSPRTPFQASIVYTYLPSAGSLQPAEADLIVSWPCLDTQDPSDLTNLTKVSGSVESHVTFLAP